MISELEWWHQNDSDFTHSLHRRTRRRFEELKQPQCAGDEREGLTRCSCRRPPELEDEERIRDLSAPLSQRRRVENEEFIYSLDSS